MKKIISLLAFMAINLSAMAQLPFILSRSFDDNSTVWYKVKIADKYLYANSSSLFEDEVLITGYDSDRKEYLWAFIEDPFGKGVNYYIVNAAKGGSFRLGSGPEAVPFDSPVSMVNTEGKFVRWKMTKSGISALFIKDSKEKFLSPRENNLVYGREPSNVEFIRVCSNAELKESERVAKEREEAAKLEAAAKEAEARLRAEKTAADAMQKVLIGSWGFTIPGQTSSLIFYENGNYGAAINFEIKRGRQVTSFVLYQVGTYVATKDGVILYQNNKKSSIEWKKIVGLSPAEIQELKRRITEQYIGKNKSQGASDGHKYYVDMLNNNNAFNATSTLTGEISTFYRVNQINRPQ